LKSNKFAKSKDAPRRSLNRQKKKAEKRVKVDKLMKEETHGFYYK
jgi:hypothetical protein